MRKKSSSISTVQILAMVVVLLGVGIALTYMLAPRKPVAPPPSEIAYESRPEERKPVYDDSPFASGFGPRGARNAQAPDADTRPTEVLAVDEGEAPPPPDQFRIVGEVVSSKTGEAVSGAQVAALRQPTPEELDKLRVMDDAAIAENNSELLSEARSFEQRIRHGETQSAGRDGKFEVKLAYAGSYELHVKKRGYIEAVLDPETLSEDRLTATVEARLSQGASISGKVSESGSSMGAEGVRILAGGTGQFAVSNAEGEYTITGLLPREYEVMAELSNTPYKTGREMPYQKVTISNPDQELKGVNFSVDPAGTVWGYVLSPGNEPISGTMVMLATSESLLSQAINMAANKAPPLGDSSEEDGYYELVGVPLNKEWRLYATSSKHSPQLADSFLLTPGSRDVRIDVYMFSGSAVYGRVVDSNRAPVPGAEVICMPSYSNLLGPMQSPHAFRESRSDEAGEFEIAELPAGNYQIFAQKEGYKITMVGQPLFPDGYNSISNVELVLQGVAEGDYAVFGKVTNTAGQPVQGADIALQGLGMESLNTSERSTSSDSSGQYRFDGVEMGSYQLTAKKEGYSPKNLGRVRLDEANDIVLSESALVRGRVLVTETNQPPLSGFTVAALPLSASNAGSVSPFGVLDGTQKASFEAGDGRFELYLSEGDYRLEAKAENYTPGRTDIAVVAGETLNDINLFITENGATVAGQVVTRGGSPQGATVYLVEATTPGEAMIMMAGGEAAGLRTMRVGSDGAFLFEKLAAGSYVVIAEHESYATGHSELIFLDEGQEVDNIEVRLGTGGALEGYVYREGSPSSGAMVALLGMGVTETASTDENGYYYVDGLATGTYQAMVTAANLADLGGIYDTQGVPIDVEEGRTTRHDFGTGEGIAIEGMCLPGPGGIMGGRAVLRLPGMGQVPLGGMEDVTNLAGQSTGIDPGGIFIMDGIQPGEWQLDIYYFELGMANPFQVRYVHSELISVTGETEVLPLQLNIGVF